MNEHHKFLEFELTWMLECIHRLPERFGVITLPNHFQQLSAIDTPIALRNQSARPKRRHFGYIPDKLPDLEPNIPSWTSRRPPVTSAVVIVTTSRGRTRSIAVAVRVRWDVRIHQLVVHGRNINVVDFSVERKNPKFSWENTNTDGGQFVYGKNQLVKILNRTPQIHSFELPQTTVVKIWAACDIRCRIGSN